MKKITDWLAGRFSPLFSISFLTVQAILVWLAIGAEAKHGFWNVYSIIVVCMMALVFARGIARFVRYGTQMYHEPK